MPDQVYPDLTNSKFDIKYARRKILSSDLKAFKVPGATTVTRSIEIEEGDPDLPGIDSVLSVEQDLTADRVINFAGHNLAFENIPEDVTEYIIYIDPVTKNIYMGVVPGSGSDTGDSDSGVGSIRFGAAGEDDVATENRSFDVNGFNFGIQGLPELQTEYQVYIDPITGIFTYGPASGSGSDGGGSGGGATYIFQNGITETGGTVELGGSLIKDTDIVGGNFNLTITSTGGGLRSFSTAGTPLTAMFNGSATNTVSPVIVIQGFTSGTAAAGLGASIDFHLENATSSAIMNQIISKLTNATDATRRSQLIITGVDSGTTRNLALMDGTGGITLPGAGAPSTTLDAQNTTGVASKGISSSGVGMWGISTSNVGVQANSISNIALFASINPASTNTAVTIATFERNTQTTAGNNIGGSLDIKLQVSGGSTQLSNQFVSKFTDVTIATRTSTAIITGVLSGSTVDVWTMNANGSVQLRPITATAASAITPAEGMLLFVSSTDATFTSIGLWCYENAAWSKK